MYTAADDARVSRNTPPAACWARVRGSTASCIPMIAARRACAAVRRWNESGSPGCSSSEPTGPLALPVELAEVIAVAPHHPPPAARLGRGRACCQATNALDNGRDRRERAQARIGPEAMSRELSFSAAGERLDASLLRPAGARLLYVLAHGAGAGMRHSFLESIADALGKECVATFR